MGKVEKFEDLIAWQKARELTKEIYEISCQEPFNKDVGLRNQIQRAAVSIMANLAEGFERGKLTEFHQFISIAKSSCAEVRFICMLLWMPDIWQAISLIKLWPKPKNFP